MLLHQRIDVVVKMQPLINRSFSVIILALCLAGIEISACSQVPQKLLSARELQDDFQILRTTFERAHAGLYRYTQKREMDAAFDRASARLNKPMTELTFYRLLIPLIDLIHDSHTQLRLTKETQRWAIKSKKFFPFDIRYVDGRAFIEKNDSENKEIPRGGEILSINHTPMPEITRKILMTQSADGFNRSPQFESANQAFWFKYFSMVDESETFEIEVRYLDKSRRYSVRGVSAAVVNNSQFKTQKHQTFSLDFVEDGQLALMTIPTLGDLAIADQFAEAFRKIREMGIQTLIIDIRDNGGGWDELNTELLSYLVPHPFRFYKGFTHRATTWEDLKYVKYSFDDFLNMPDLKRPEAERRKIVGDRTLSEILDYNYPTNPASGIHLPKPANTFSGALYLLFNGASGSSGAEIPTLLHFLGVGTLIGEEPNGAYQGVCGGVIPTLPLPHSGMAVSFPLLAYQNAVLPDLFVNHGVRPHFTVTETLEDAIRERDTVLEFTLQLIKARQAKTNQEARLF